MLDAPQNNEDSTDKYSCQICVSWPHRKDFFGNQSPIEIPETNKARYDLIQAFAQTWAEPFRSVAQGIPEDTEIKDLEPNDFPPPKGLRTSGRAVLMGDAFHAMAMCKRYDPISVAWSL